MSKNKGLLKSQKCRKVEDVDPSSSDQCNSSKNGSATTHSNQTKNPKERNTTKTIQIDDLNQKEIGSISIESFFQSIEKEISTRSLLDLEHLLQNAYLLKSKRENEIKATYAFQMKDIDQKRDRLRIMKSDMQKSMKGFSETKRLAENEKLEKKYDLENTAIDRREKEVIDQYKASILMNNISFESAVPVLENAIKLKKSPNDEKDNSGCHVENPILFELIKMFDNKHADASKLFSDQLKQILVDHLFTNNHYLNIPEEQKGELVELKEVENYFKSLATIPAHTEEVIKQLISYTTEDLSSDQLNEIKNKLRSKKLEIIHFMTQLYSLKRKELHDVKDQLQDDYYRLECEKLMNRSDSELKKLSLNEKMLAKNKSNLEKYVTYYKICEDGILRVTENIFNLIESKIGKKADNPHNHSQNISEENNKTNDFSLDNLPSLSAEEYRKFVEHDFAKLTIPELENTLKSLNMNKIEYEKQAESLLKQQRIELEQLRNEYRANQAKIRKLKKTSINASELAQYDELYNQCNLNIQTLDKGEEATIRQFAEKVNKLNTEWAICVGIVEKLISIRKKL